MVKLLNHASLFKDDDSRLRKATFGSKCYVLCDLASFENAKHMVMECLYHIENRTRMSDEFNKVCPGMNTKLLLG